MKTISLNGIWQYRIGYGAFSDISVPFSKLPVGRSECVRFFDTPTEYNRLFLKFDGITYYAEVFLNGHRLGEMLPYCEYEFDISDIVIDTANELKVVLEDINRAFGPSEGWENFGGIIRDVNLILRDVHYIENVFFKTSPAKDLTSAEMRVEVDAVCSENAFVQITLSDNNKLVCVYEQSVNEPRSFTVDNIRLWSPDSPCLYTLSVKLFCDGREKDLYSCQVGFRFLSHDGHIFHLNGKPLFLKGVCKHEMVADSGHCPTYAQMEDDLLMIKSMGCNFVRLVHYPHNKQILALADQIGLLVSEEPGLWWSDTSDSEVAQGSKEVLRRTILRDRNHACVAFWLCFNECRFTDSFLMESASLCRKYDPTRMVSGANCMSDEETLFYYNKCGFDFYTMHPYAPTFDRAQKSAEILCDKPLLFTEWGGYFLYDNPHLMMDFMESMHELYRNGSLAGAFFWFFAELNDFNRGAPACIDGVLREGLVDSLRNPTSVYDAFCRGLRLFDNKSDIPKDLFWYESVGVTEDLSSDYELIAETAPSDALMKKFLSEEIETNGYMRKRKITYGPLLPQCTPQIVCRNKTAAFSVGRKATQITVLGLTTIKNGYPLGGMYGDTVCDMTIEYADGSFETIPLQNGVHITTAFALRGSSEINPIAEKACRIAKFGYDKNFEKYVINRLDIPLCTDQSVETVRFSAENDTYAVLIYHVYAV